MLHHCIYCYRYNCTRGNKRITHCTVPEILTIHVTTSVELTVTVIVDGSVVVSVSGSESVKDISVGP